MKKRLNGRRIYAVIAIIIFIFITGVVLFPGCSAGSGDKSQVVFTNLSVVNRREAAAVADFHLKRASSRSEMVEMYPDFFSGKSSGADGEPKLLMDSDRVAVLGYVFEMEPRGYVVVPRKKFLPPVIAYSYSSDFAWDEHPDNVLLYLLRRDLQMRQAAYDNDAISQEILRRNRRKWERYMNRTMPSRAMSRTTWGPLIFFPTWNQGNPYWAYCPDDPDTGTRCYVGCVATSMAQVVNYWQNPTTVVLTGADDYTTATKSIFIDAAPASYSNVDFNSGYPTNDVKAKVSYALGVLVDMNYTSSGSGASMGSARNAFKYRLGFSSARYLGGFATADINDNVQNGIPVQISIHKPGAGHAINVDGYDDSNNTYHLNYGWGGSTDGWYEVPGGMGAGYESVGGSNVDLKPLFIGRLSDWTYDNAFISCYNSNGGEAVLGQPFDDGNGVTCRQWGPGNTGWIQDVNGGSAGDCSIIRKDSVATAYVLKNSIRDKYISLGGPSYALGWPVGNESTPDINPDAATSGWTTDGKVNPFEQGSIYKHANGPFANQSFEVHGPVKDKYSTFGGTDSALGFPISDRSNAPASGVSGKPGTYNNFEGGGVYNWEEGTFEVHGKVYDKWVTLGTSSSALGFPITDIYQVGGKDYCNFEGGYIYINAGGDATVQYSSPSIPPNAPDNLASPRHSYNSIDLSWNDNSAIEDGFRIERKTEGGAYGEIATVNADVTTYTCAELSPETKYYFRVRSYNAGGNSDYSNEITVTTGIAPPTAPTDLLVESAAQTEVKLAWTDNANNETGFRLERKGPGKADYTVISEPGENTTTYTDSNVSPGSTYYYRICACNSTGDSGYSEVTAETPDTLPVAPDSLTAEKNSDGKVVLQWSDNSNNELGFKIERVSKNSYTQVGTVGQNLTTYTDEEVSADGYYAYRVRSYNGAGNSEYSNEADINLASSSGGSSGGGGGGGGGGGCFIATAAFGSYQEEHVWVLREFRDKHLLTNKPGKAFVKAYYKYSPPMADWIAKHNLVRSVTRAALMPLYGFAYLANNGLLHLAPLTMLAMILMLVFYLRTRKKKAVKES